MTRAALALLLGFTACTSAGGPAPGTGSSAGNVHVELNARRAEPPTLQEPSTGQAQTPTGIQATGETGRIDVKGHMQTPDPCRRLSGTVDASGREVTLRVNATREGEMCTQVIANFAYDAAITGLESGTYRLRVVHAYPGTGWDTQTALDQSVTVR